MENTLVDILYYDYLLTRMIDMYLEDTSPSEIAPYADIATQVNRALRSNDAAFDTELYIKEIYVKTLQMVKNNNRLGQIRRLMETVSIIKAECDDIEKDSRFMKIQGIINCCILYYSLGEKTTEEEALSRWNDLLGMTKVPEEFPYSIVWRVLRDITFERPGLIYYANQLIEESTKKEPVNITEICEKTGEKVTWD